MRSIPVSRLHQQAGFSLVELSVTLALILALSGFAVLNITAILPGMRANEAMYQAVAQLRKGRESAIAQRRNIEVSSWETIKYSWSGMMYRPEQRS